MSTAGRAPPASHTPDAELRRILASTPNPFSDAVLQSAWRDTPDVEAIHGDIRRRLSSLIEEARASGGSVVQVVTGDPGEGKTHLLAWLRRLAEREWMRADGRPFALAPIQPLRRSEYPLRHFLNETIRSLRRSLSDAQPFEWAPVTPLDLFLWRALVAVARVLVRNVRGDSSLARALEGLLARHTARFPATFAVEVEEVWPSIEEEFVHAAVGQRELSRIDPEVLRVIARWPRPELRADVADWLSGASLPADRLAGLGTRLLLDEEDTAARALESLLHLARVAGVPLVLAFDQIEGTRQRGDDAVASFLASVAELYNAEGSAVFLVLCQTTLWPQLRALAERQVQDRLETSPPLHLGLLHTDEALALVEARLRHFWAGQGVVPEEPLHPFQRADVRARIERDDLSTPRRVIQYFQRLVTDPEAEAGTARATAAPASAPSQSSDQTDRGLVRRKYEALLEEERRGPPREPQSRADLAANVAQQVFEAVAAGGRVVAGAKVLEVVRLRIGRTRSEGMRVVLERGGVRRRVYLEASNATHHASVAATVKRLRDVVDSGEADRGLLLREDGFPLPPAAERIVAELTPRGAVVWLSEGEVPPLAALETLLNAAAAGDLSVEPGTARAIGAGELGAELPAIVRIVGEALREPGAKVAGAADAAIVGRVLSHLRTHRATLDVPQLAKEIGEPVDRVHAAVEKLRERGQVDLGADRDQIPVVLLRPDAL